MLTTTSPSSATPTPACELQAQERRVAQAPQTPVYGLPAEGAAETAEVLVERGREEGQALTST